MAKKKKKKKKSKKYKKISIKEAFNIHRRRSVKAQRIDNRKTEKIVDDERYRKNPKFYDFKGVDTAKKKVVPDIPKTIDVLTADLKKDRMLFTSLKKLPKKFDKYTVNQATVMINKNLKELRRFSGVVRKINERDTKIVKMKNYLDSQIDNKSVMRDDIINSTKKRFKPLSIKEARKKQNIKK